MITKKDYVIIFKNDAVGDLTQSLRAIYKILKKYKNQKIIIYLSERSEKFNFLIKGDNIEFRKLNYNISLFEKFRIFFLVLTSKISDVFILTPKKFYFYLPFLFRNIKFHALCINGQNNYKRPSEFLRKYLYKYEINNRAAKYKREHTTKIQEKLIDYQINNDQNLIIKTKISPFLEKNLPKNFIYFHLKKEIVQKLGWNENNLKELFDNLLNYYDSLVITQDIEKNINQNFIRESFNYIDFENRKIFIKNKNSKIILFDNIEGEDLYNTIYKSSKILAFHGMMTNLGAIQEKSITDMWYCEINNLKDYRNYRNAFYEFKPNYKRYNFIIPSKDIKKTIKKLKFSLVK